MFDVRVTLVARKTASLKPVAGVLVFRKGTPEAAARNALARARVHCNRGAALINHATRRPRNKRRRALTAGDFRGRN